MTRLRTAILAALALGACVIAWFLPIATRMIVDGDYPAHIAFARRLGTEPVTMPHVLFHLLVAALARTIPRFSWNEAGIMVVVALQIATALTIAAYFSLAGLRQSLWVWLTVAVMMSAPLLPAMADVLLTGYFPANAYHNPTLVAVRPFAVPVLVIGAAMIGRRHGVRITAPVAVAVVVLSVLAKPNLVLCFLPAMLVGAAWEGRRDGVQWKGVALVAAASLAALIAAAIVLQGGGVDIAPFAVIALYGSVGSALAWKLPASIAFPAAVVACFPRASAKHPELPLAWMMFAAGVAQAYFLAEPMPRLPDGNFFWGGHVSALALFAASAAVVGEDLQNKGGGWRAPLCLGLLGVHVISGLRHVTLKVPAERWLAGSTWLAVAIVIAWQLAVALRRRAQPPGVAAGA